LGRSAFRAFGRFCAFATRLTAFKRFTAWLFGLLHYSPRGSTKGIVSIQAGTLEEAQREIQQGRLVVADRSIASLWLSAGHVRWSTSNFGHIAAPHEGMRCANSGYAAPRISTPDFEVASGCLREKCAISDILDATGPAVKAAHSSPVILDELGTQGPLQ